LSVAVTITSNYPGLSRNGEKLEKPSVKGKIQSLCNRTDTDAIQFLDPETLEPIGVASQTTLHPLLRGPSSATHSSTDLNGDVYNYNLDFMNGQGVYRVFRVSACTGHTSILATITDNPAYIHSTLLTEHYMILCVWNAHYAFGGASILWTKNIVDALADYDPDRPCRWYVIDKRPLEAGGGLVATFESDPFFCFHTINAYEEVDKDGKVDIIADLVAYENLDILKRLYIENLISNSSTAVDFSTLPTCRPQIRRFTLANVEGQMTDKFGVFPGDESVGLEATSTLLSLKNLTPELPTINPSMLLKKHRFVYGVLHTGKSTLFDSIVKYDVSSQTAKMWSKHGHTPGEPIFVADPTGTGEEDEDVGILLSVVLDGVGGKSYLLVLDARTMEEIGKAKVPGVIGFGFHGTHVPC
jgi:torulene dioxygenase